MRSSVQIITILLPISVLTLANSHDVVSVVFGHGRFDANAVQSCSIALIGYGCMFVPFALRELFSRFQYAYGDSKTPMINSTIAIVINIILSITLSIWLGVLGVTLATSISVLICAILNIVTSRKKNEFLHVNQMFKTLPQWIIGAAICVGVSFGGQYLLADIHTIFRFLIIAVVSLLLYFAINFATIKPLVKNLISK